jgi:hypothetical protein
MIITLIIIVTTYFGPQSQPVQLTPLRMINAIVLNLRDSLHPD